MNIENIKPEDIEKRSMEIIQSEIESNPEYKILTDSMSEAEKLVLKRVIHTTADFEYINNLIFSKDAVEKGIEAIKKGAVIVTDTNMARCGISSPAIKTLGCELHCFMADDDILLVAKERGCTRAVASVEKAMELYSERELIYVVGNAPTALIRIAELIEENKISPSLVVGAPVGFVNIIQSKEMIKKSGVPYIVADGRKGGSTVAAAICNAMLYQVYKR